MQKFIPTKIWFFKVRSFSPRKWFILINGFVKKPLTSSKKSGLYCIIVAQSVVVKTLFWKLLFSKLHFLLVSSVLNFLFRLMFLLSEPCILLPSKRQVNQHITYDRIIGKMFKKEINRTCRNTVFSLISPSPLISVALPNASLIKNIAIFWHYLNQEGYEASMQTKEKWKCCSYFDIFI